MVKGDSNCTPSSILKSIRRNGPLQLPLTRMSPEELLPASVQVSGEFSDTSPGLVHPGSRAASTLPSPSLSRPSLHCVAPEGVVPPGAPVQVLARAPLNSWTIRDQPFTVSVCSLSARLRLRRDASLWAASAIASPELA